MQYHFPIINTIDDVLPHINEENFSVKEREGYTVVSYRMAGNDTFPTVDEEADITAKIRRECRGLVFSSDGNIIARRYHKFFNMGERADVLPDIVYNTMESTPFVLMYKEDGSMVSPVRVNGDIAWMTKAGVTEVAMMAADFANEWDSKLPHDECGYEALSNHLLDMDYTPIYEFCSKRNRIVLTYEEDHLILTAARHMIHGNYMPVDELEQLCTEYQVPLVHFIGIDHTLAGDYIASQKRREDSEGLVLRFADGHMVKIKTDWYITLHRIINEINVERNLLNATLSGIIDDVKSNLNDDRLTEISEYEAAVWKAVRHLHSTINTLQGRIIDANMSRKEFSLEYSHLSPFERNLVFNSFGEEVDMLVIVDALREHTGNTRQYERIAEFVPRAT